MLHCCSSNQSHSHQLPSHRLLSLPGGHPPLATGLHLVYILHAEFLPQHCQCWEAVPGWLEGEALSVGTGGGGCRVKWASLSTRRRGQWTRNQSPVQCSVESDRFKRNCWCRPPSSRSISDILERYRNFYLNKSGFFSCPAILPYCLSICLSAFFTVTIISANAPHRHRLIVWTRARS